MVVSGSGGDGRGCCKGKRGEMKAMGSRIAGRWCADLQIQLGFKRSWWSKKKKLAPQSFRRRESEVLSRSAIAWLFAIVSSTATEVGWRYHQYMQYHQSPQL